jgi:hypothetical protein
VQTYISKLVFLLLSVIVFNTSLQSQYKNNDSDRHPYKVNYWVSGGIAAAGLVSNYLGIPHIIYKPEISAAE